VLHPELIVDCFEAARRRAPVLALVLGLVTGAPRRVAGDPGPQRPSPPPTVELRYTRHAGTEDCPDEPTLQKALIDRLGWDPFLSAAAGPPGPAPSSKASTIRLAVMVQRARRGHEARIDLQDPTGRTVATRRLHSTEGDCRELGSALALALALAIDPLGLYAPAKAADRGGGAGSSPSPPSPRPSSSPLATGPSRPLAAGPPATSPPRPSDGGPSTPTVVVVDPPERRPPPLPVRPPPPRPPGVRFRGGFELHAAVGTAPTAAFGGTLVAGARWPYVSLNAEARADVPSSVRVNPGRVSAWLATGSVVPCGHISFFTGCVLVGLGPLTASASGLGPPRQTVGLLVHVGVRGAVELPLTRVLHLLLQAEVRVALTRPSLFVADTGGGSPEREVFRTPRVGGTLGAGLLFYLGR
jgi:hypothetical protein